MSQIILIKSKRIKDKTHVYVKDVYDVSVLLSHNMYYSTTQLSVVLNWFLLHATISPRIDRRHVWDWRLHVWVKFPIIIILCSEDYDTSLMKENIYILDKIIRILIIWHNFYNARVYTVTVSHFNSLTLC